jgi:hypothetical protein
VIAAAIRFSPVLYKPNASFQNMSGYWASARPGGQEGRRGKLSLMPSYMLRGPSVSSFPTLLLVI